MNRFIKNKHIFVRIFVVAILLLLYTVIRINKLNISALKHSDLQYQKEIKNKENLISDLQNELKMSSTKGYIEKQARMDGFIMPDDMHFIYELNINQQDDNNN